MDFCAKHGCFSRKLHCFFAKLVHFLTDRANHERKGKTSPQKGGSRRTKQTEGGRRWEHFAFRRRTSRPTSCPRFCQVPFVLERTTAKTADENAESRRRCWGARPKFVILRENRPLSIRHLRIHEFHTRTLWPTIPPAHRSPPVATSPPRGFHGAVGHRFGGGGASSAQPNGTLSPLLGDRPLFPRVARR